eukprot:2292264-Prymnesium_polylepis.1
MESVVRPLTTLSQSQFGRMLVETTAPLTRGACVTARPSGQINALADAAVANLVFTTVITDAIETSAGTVIAREILTDAAV